MQVTSRATVHKATAAVRGMNSEEFSSLMDSMRTTGQVYPILTHRGEIVDGRERLKACQRLKIEPIILKVDPDKDPLDVIYAANICRKHLDVSARAAAASLLNTRSPEDLAALGISKRSVEYADKVYRNGAPETIEAMEKGKAAVSRLSQISDLPKQHQAKLVQKIQEGKKSEVIAELDAIKPVRKQATNERPTVRYPETEIMTPDKNVESFNRTEDRIETMRRLFLECEPHELMVIATFIPVEYLPTERRVQEPVKAAIEELSEDDAGPDTELPDFETIEVIQDRISDEMIESPAMVGLGGRIGSLATAVGAVRLLFAATEKYAPKGDVGQLSDPAIATACGYTGQADGFVSAMVQEGFLQRDIEHRLLVTDWPDLCPRDLAEELCGTGVGYAEPTGIPKMKEKPAPKVRNTKPGQYSDAFERFWQAYPSPRKKAKLKAWAGWQRAMHIAVAPEGRAIDEWLIERATQYAKSWKGQSKFSNAPEVWLNGGMWDDSPEAWMESSEQKLDINKPLQVSHRPKPIPGIGLRPTVAMSQ